MALASKVSQKDVQSLEYWLTRSCDPYLCDTSRPEYVLGFCEQVNEELEGPQIACKLLAHKFQSPYHIEALHALKLLDSCVRNCGVRFHNEIGKFRFLNELIKILSPKYMGSQTHKDVKTRSVEMLYSWKKSLKMQPKIGQAYDMLKEQGVIQQDPSYMDEIYEPPPDPPKPRQAAFEDEEKSRLLAQLLVSRNAEDLQAANRLIKSMVKAEDQKMEKMSKRCEDLQTAGNNAALLKDMVKMFKPNTATTDDFEIMNELSDSLSSIRSTLYRYASEAADGGEDALASVLCVNDEVSKAIEEFKLRVKPHVVNNNKKHNTNNSQSLQSNANALETLLSLDLPMGRLGDTPTLSDTSSMTSDDVNLLGGLGTPLMARKDTQKASPKHEPKQDIDIINKLHQLAMEKDKLVNMGSVFGRAAVTEISRPRGLADLDALSESLIQDNLPPDVSWVRQDSINNKQQRQKVPMRELYQSPPSLSPLDPKPSIQLESTKTVTPVTNYKVEIGSDLLVDFDTSPSPPVVEPEPCPPIPLPPAPMNIDDVILKLVDVKPNATEALVLYDQNKIKILLHELLNRPREDVRAWVLSVTSVNAKLVEAVKLEVLLESECSDVVMKLVAPCEELLHCLPAFNPIFPPTPLSYILLVGNRDEKQIVVKMKYEFQYKLDEIIKDNGKFDVNFEA